MSETKIKALQGIITQKNSLIAQLKEDLAEARAVKPDNILGQAQEALRQAEAENTDLRKRLKEARAKVADVAQAAMAVNSIPERTKKESAPEDARHGRPDPDAEE